MVSISSPRFSAETGSTTRTVLRQTAPSPSVSVSSTEVKTVAVDPAFSSRSALPPEKVSPATL